MLSVAQSQYKNLVEKIPAGQYYRFVVLNTTASIAVLYIVKF